MKDIRDIFEEYKFKYRKKHFEKYKYVDDIFIDYYFNGGVLRKKEYDIEFKKGDIVTGGFSLGIVKEDCDGEFPKVYSRYTSYEKYNNLPISGFGNSKSHWYKTGINVSLAEWKDFCLFFEDVWHEYWKMKKGIY